MSEVKNEYTGTVVKVLPKMTGQGAKGSWQKQQFVIETEGQYPKKIAFDLWGDKVDKCPKEGDMVTVGYNAESREYNEICNTYLKAWKVVVEKKTPLTNEQKENVKELNGKLDLTTDDSEKLPF